MCTIGIPAERARSSSLAASSRANATPSSAITPCTYVFWQSIMISVESARLAGVDGRPLRARNVVGSGIVLLQGLARSNVYEARSAHVAARATVTTVEPRL